MPRFSDEGQEYRAKIARLMGNGFLVAMDQVIYAHTLAIGRAIQNTSAGLSGRVVPIGELYIAEHTVRNHYIMLQADYQRLQREYRRTGEYTPTQVRRKARMASAWISRESDEQPRTRSLSANRCHQHLSRDTPHTTVSLPGAPPIPRRPWLNINSARGELAWCSARTEEQRAAATSYVYSRVPERIRNYIDQNFPLPSQSPGAIRQLLSPEPFRYNNGLREEQNMSNAGAYWPPYDNSLVSTLQNLSQAWINAYESEYRAVLLNELYSWPDNSILDDFWSEMPTSYIEQRIETLYDSEEEDNH